MSDIVIKVNKLNKTYRTKVSHSSIKENIYSLFSPQYNINKVLNDINLSIHQGEHIAILGKNGAGKSTLIKILCGIIGHDSGEIDILGYNPHKQSKDFFKNIGVVFGHKSSLWWDLPLEDSLRLVKTMYSIKNERFNENYEEVIESLNLAAVLSRPIRNLSLGERVKGELAFNLLFEPKILFLDEPTIGLDIPSKYAIRKLLDNMKKERGLSILLTSHDMKDIEGYCDCIKIIDEGKICFSGNQQELQEQINIPTNISIKFNDTHERESLLNFIENIIQENKNISTQITYTYNESEVIFSVPQCHANKFYSLFSQKLKNNISLRTADLEEIIYQQFSQESTISRSIV